MRVVVLSFFLLFVACNGGEPGVDTTSTVPTTTTSTAPTSLPPPPPAGEAMVQLSDGGYLVDEEGNSLYLFTLDTDRTSSCEGECAGAWPPLLGTAVAAEGVDEGMLGNAERADGSIQVTYDGHPLYRYRGDAEAGDTNGHRFNDVWFLIGPDGQPLD